MTAIPFSSSEAASTGEIRAKPRLASRTVAASKIDLLKFLSNIAVAFLNWRHAARCYMRGALLHRADQLQHLDGAWAELLRELVLDRLGVLDKAGLVDAPDEFDPHLLEACHRIVLERERLFRHDLGDLVGRGLDPALLLVIEAVPHLVADP